jgi:hypothetical protein
MPGSLHACSPSPEPDASHVQPTRGRHVRFAPGVISPAVRPPRRVEDHLPNMLFMTPPGRIDRPNPQKLSRLRHPYLQEPKDSLVVNRRKPQEIAKVSLRGIIPKSLVDPSSSLATLESVRGRPIVRSTPDGPPRNVTSASPINQRTQPEATVTTSPRPVFLNRVPEPLPVLHLGRPVPRMSPGSSHGISEPSPVVQHPELDPTRCVERRLSPKVDETVNCLIPDHSSFDHSAELERIRELEEEVKMLREEVSLAHSHKDDMLTEMLL